MNLTEKTISSKTIYEGKVLTVKVDEVELFDKSRSKREIVEHGGGACVLAVYENKIPLVEQFRYAYNKTLWELPAGKIEKGEQGLVCAKRELVEETGLWAEELVLLNVLYPSPGYTNEKIYLYFAEKTCKVEQKLDSGEYLNVKFFTVDEILKMIDSGEICDAKTIVAVYKYLLMQKG